VGAPEKGILNPGSVLGLGIAAAVAIALVALGSTAFRWVERSFADVI
jgi:hypothetical protein